MRVLVSKCTTFSKVWSSGKSLPAVRLFVCEQTKYSCFSTSSKMAGQQLINIGQLSINYEKVGDGPPALCLPGALGYIQSDFGPQLNSKLKDKNTLVVWDPPGYGKSRPPDRDFSGGAQFFYRDAKLAHELMTQLGYKKYSVLGWSDGGITGLILAAMFPASVDKLVVWGANAYVDQTDIDAYVAIKDIRKWSDKMKAPMIEMYGEEYFRKMWEDWVDEFVDIYKNGGDLCKDDVSKITCDTLIIHGALDPIVGLEHAEYLNKNIKGSKLEIISGAKHNVHLHPKYLDEFNTLVEKFIT